MVTLFYKNFDSYLKSATSFHVSHRSICNTEIAIEDNLSVIHRSEEIIIVEIWTVNERICGTRTGAKKLLLHLAVLNPWWSDTDVCLCLKQNSCLEFTIFPTSLLTTIRPRFTTTSWNVYIPATIKLYSSYQSHS